MQSRPSFLTNITVTRSEGYHRRLPGRDWVSTKFIPDPSFFKTKTTTVCSLSDPDLCLPPCLYHLSHLYLHKTCIETALGWALGPWLEEMLGSGKAQHCLDDLWYSYSTHVYSLTNEGPKICHHKTSSTTIENGWNLTIKNTIFLRLAWKGVESVRKSLMFPKRNAPLFCIFSWEVVQCHIMKFGCSFQRNPWLKTPILHKLRVRFS